MNKYGILPLLHTSSGCDYHRVVLPLTYMGIDINSFNTKTIGQSIAETKILLFNRTPHGDIKFYMDARKKYGFKIVVDIDDYWVLHPKHNLYGNWQRSQMDKQIADSLSIADVVTCTTSLLADKVKLLNKNVHIIPNGLPFGHDQFNDSRNTDEENIRFIYAGGSSHMWDLKTLNIPFTKVANNPQLKNAKFIFAGFNDTTAHSKSEWEKFEKVFTVNGKIKNYERKHTFPLNIYMDHYKNADVNLIPIEDNHFNRFKSNLKIIEAGCKNIACIASDLEPYSNEPDRSKLMYAKNASGWYDHIKYCTQNPSFVKESGLELGEYVRARYDLMKINETRKQIFENLMS